MRKFVRYNVYYKNNISFILIEFNLFNSHYICFLKIVIRYIQKLVKYKNLIHIVNVV